jgi:hypothetical protein
MSQILNLLGLCPVKDLSSLNSYDQTSNIVLSFAFKISAGATICVWVWKDWSSMIRVVLAPKKVVGNQIMWNAIC